MSLSHPSPRTQTPLWQDECLPGWAGDDPLAAFTCFKRQAQAMVAGAAALRKALPPTPDLQALARQAVAARVATPAEARAFFERYTTPTLLQNDGFVTGYYEPVVAGSLTPTEDCAYPLHGVPFAAPALAHPHPPRLAFMETPALAPVMAYVHDAVEAFFIHVQGSACLRLPDGRLQRLTYAGRNGEAYQSIGQLVRAQLGVETLTMAALKAWLYQAGLKPGEAGWQMLAQNPSYIYFSLAAADLDAPIGGAGLPLTPYRSLAIDRTQHPYGTLLFVQADLPHGHHAKLMVAQDTGSAMVGHARGDIFCGTGDAAGMVAGAVAHKASFTWLKPNPAALGVAAS